MTGLTLSIFTWKSLKGWNSCKSIVKLSTKGAFVSACIKPLFLPNFCWKLDVLLPLGLDWIEESVGPNTNTSVKLESPALLNPKNILNYTWEGASSPLDFLVAIIVGNLKFNFNLSISGWFVIPIVLAEIVIADAVAFPEAVV